MRRHRFHPASQPSLLDISWEGGFRAWAVGALRLGLVLPLALLSGCATRAFRFDPLPTPRVSVTHRPLNPSADEAVVLTAKAEAGEGATIDEIVLTLLRPDADGNSVETHTCPNSEECSHEFEPNGTAGLAAYDAEVVDSNTRRGFAPASYVFRIGAGASEAPFPLRVPLEAERPLAAPLRVPFLRLGRAFKVLLVRDAATYGDDGDLLEDIQASVNDRLLADPAYRWRDDQLGFYYTTKPGTTTDYYSGQITRCGQEPWPFEPRPAWLGRFDAVGVLHRLDDARDCAGLGIVRSGASAKRHFSAYGPELGAIQHELGHALFGLADEYQESTESRTAPGLPPGRNHDCECCRNPGGIIVGDPCDPFADCERILLECAPAICPPIASTCTFSNVMESEDDCTEAATIINEARGVEQEARPEACRQICDGNCPCEDGSRQHWTLDEQRPLTDPPTPDVMEDLAADRHGPACRLCMEVTFCELWETGRGRSAAQVTATCTPPED